MRLLAYHRKTTHPFLYAYLLAFGTGRKIKYNRTRLFFITFNSLKVYFIEKSTRANNTQSLNTFIHLLHLRDKAAVKQSLNFCLLLE